MTSALSWLDHDASERDRIQRILALFKEQDTRDELGLGAIRDAIADLLFPGTSTIQTRLRYFLFVPWIHRSIEAERLAGEASAARVRDLELAIRNALVEGPFVDGVIGREAGAALKRGPSSVYWAGLGRWAVRRFEGSEDDYHRALPGIHRARHGRQTRPVREEPEGAIHTPIETWHPDLPEAPEGFPREAGLTLTLTTEEADFLRDLIARSCRGSLFARLVEWADRPVPDVDFAWEHPDFARLDPVHQEQLGHARSFSLVMNGASVLYNLMLAQKAGREERAEAHAARLAKWVGRVASAAPEQWSLPAFWEMVWDRGHTITPRTQRFVEAWTAEVLADPSGVATRKSARDLVESRETRLKGARSRFRSQRALDQWGGSSAVEPLGFRWRTAKTFLNDLHAALSGGGGA